MIAFCDDESVLGADFYVMGRIDGVIPRTEWPADVPLDAEQARRLCLNFIDTLVEVHSVDPSTTGLADLGKGPGYVRRQVEGWSARFRNAHTDDVPDFELKAIEHFFLHYKDLEPGKHVTPGEWRDKAHGEKLVAEGLENFVEHPEEKAEPFRG